MKATLSLLAVVFGLELTPSVFGQQVDCANVPPPGPKKCLGKMDICTSNVTGCCDGFVCSGFSFYKRCIAPPVCREQWHDCATPDGYSMKCCPPYVCGQTPAGNWACQEDGIGVRKVDIPGSNLKSTSAPTPAPTPSKNLNVTTIPGQPVKLNVACALGDPHVYTFDGLKYDCQSEGEHILLKSLITQRQIQGYYEHYATNKAISVTKGVVIQDEGDTPLVQISMPQLKSTPATPFGSNNCNVMLFIDKVQRDLFDPALATSKKVQITVSGATIKILYPTSQFYVTVNMGFWNVCLLNVCANLPSTDKVVGILGTANGNTQDDWTLLNGTALPVPTTYADRLAKEGYAFCNKYCIRNKADSLFVHPEKGIDFDYVNHCELPFGSTLEQIIANVSQAVLDICGDDVECIMDGVVGGVGAAKDTKNARLPIGATCNNAGGECSVASCCAGLKCVDTGKNGKFCGTPPKCAVEMADCSSSPCCDTLTCVADNFGKKSCKSVNQCKPEWKSCNADADCCDTLTCTDNLKGGKHCRLLPKCMPIWDECSRVGCCDGLECVSTKGGGKQCQQNPVCWDEEWKDCTTIPCCEGMTCIVQDDRNVCVELPECEDIGGSSQYVDCCVHDHQNAICADVVDAKGRKGKQCKLNPVDLKIRVFDDCNGNGQFDDGENGLTAVAVRLVTADDGDQVLNQNDGGTAHQEMRTDTDGFVTFTKVPRGVSLAALVVYPPGGAVPTTMKKQGVSDDVCSGLKSHTLSDVFNFDASTQMQKTMSLGYLMPNDATVTIFNDANGNGIMDAGEKPMPDVRVRLVRDADGQFLSDQQNGGCAHTEVPADSTGRCKFTKVPQGVDLRFKVMNAPGGAVSTTTIPKFNLNKGACAVFNKTLIGFALPETVTVRIWDDSNSNGIQDNGELGIQGVKLRLITDANQANLPDQASGGTAHLELTTDASGVASFLNVPIGVKLRVKVTSPPNGALPSPKDQGSNPDLDSDLNADGTSDAFTLTGHEAGGLYSSTDLGYRMPDSVQVRVWDDNNANGIQDAGEPGIAKVWLRLIKASDNSTLPDQGNGGNCHQQVQTNEDGYATFTRVPKGVALRVYNPFPIRGAIATNLNAGANSQLDSDLRIDGQSTEAFILNGTVGGVFNEIDMGYRMPDDMKIRVWDDANGNGLQDAGELGIANVSLRLITDAERKNIMDYNNGGNAHLELQTDANGLCAFTKVPKGIKLRVKVTNGPPGAIRTTPNTVPSVEPAAACGVESTKTYGSVNTGDLGDFKMNPIKITKITDTQVSFKIMQNWKDRCSVSWIQTYYTGSDGVGRCPKQQEVPDCTGEYIARCDASGVAAVKVFVRDGSFRGLPDVASTMPALCQPPKNDGSISAFAFNIPCTCPRLDTTACACSREALDSNLNDDGTSNPFDMSNFEGAIYDTIDLGFRMPNDVKIRVWDDANGNGLQDYSETGVKGVNLTLVTSDGKQVVDQKNGGTAHMSLQTNDTGYVTFTKVPKGVDLRVKCVNQPAGATPTTRLTNTSLSGTNSDLLANGLTDVFNLNAFSGKTFGEVALGYRMPSDLAIRVWDDRNGNGIQDAGEPGIKDVQLQVVTAGDGNPLQNMGGGSTCHLPSKTNDTGVCTFAKCPKALDLQFKVLNAPPGSNPTTLLDSNGRSSTFNLLSFTGPSAFNQMACGYKMLKTVVIRVWNDTNKNGIQDANEPGINNCSVKLMLANGTAMPNLNNGGTAHLEMKTDGNGRVTFNNCPTGLDIKAKITGGLPSTAKPCPKKQGTDDQLDSHANADWTTDAFQVPSTCTNLFDRVDLGCTS